MKHEIIKTESRATAPFIIALKEYIRVKKIKKVHALTSGRLTAVMRHHLTRNNFL